MDNLKRTGGRAMTDNTQELDEILRQYPRLPHEQDEIRHALLDWHNKQILEIMKDEQYDDERSLSMFKYMWRNKLKESK